MTGEQSRDKNSGSNPAVRTCATCTSPIWHHSVERYRDRPTVDTVIVYECLAALLIGLAVVWL